jgi:zinc/manganese transport system permease protein
MILASSLAACLILAAFFPFLGQQVLARRIVFIDLALAQIAATGFAIGMATDSSGPLWAGAVTLLVILILAMIPERTSLPKEAIMGGAYAIASAAGMVLLARLPHGEGHMTVLMFGSLLGADGGDLLLLVICGALSLFAVRLAGEQSYGRRLLFYAGMALAVVPAIHAVGVILVFAMLLLPALAVWQNGNNGSLIHATILAFIGTITGILAANYLDLPPSSSVVLALAIVGLSSWLWCQRWSYSFR